MKRIKLPSPSMVVAVAALLVAMSGSAVAASLITSKQIKDGTIQTRDLSKRAVKALKSSSTPGPRGPQGPTGSAGAAGAVGGTGQAGAAGKPGAPGKDGA